MTNFAMTTKSLQNKANIVSQSQVGKVLNIYFVQQLCNVFYYIIGPLLATLKLFQFGPKTHK